MSDTIKNWAVSEFKKEIQSFKVTAVRIAAEKDRNTRIYQSAEADKLNAALDIQLLDAFATAGEKLTGTMNKISLKLAQWSAPNGRLLTSDAAFFTGDYNLSAKEIMDFVDMYRPNNTMTSIIREYMKKNKITGYLMPTAMEKLAVYEKFYNGAISMLNSIRSNPNTSTDTWAEFNVLSEPLYAVIGDGKELQGVDYLRFESSIQPLRVYHAEQEAFNFSFKPVNAVS